jgi:hypothetical protein
MLQDENANREKLISKWKKKTTPEMEKRCFEILDFFGIDIYQPDSFMPKDSYLIR